MRVTPDYALILTFPNLVVFVLLCQTELGVLDHTRACLAPKNSGLLAHTKSSSSHLSSIFFSSSSTSVVTTTVILLFLSTLCFYQLCDK